MFKNSYQNGFLSVLYAGGAKPLSIWGQVVKNGHIRRVTDEDVQTLALEIMGTNVATTYIICPANPKAHLGIRLPFFVMIVKNMKKYFTFEIQILDDKNMSRRFRVSNYQSATRVRPFSTCLPIGLTGGWNQIQFNLADFTRRAYGSSYLETMRVQIHANVRIRRIYFCDRLYNEDELPADFKLYVPISTQRKDKAGKKDAKIVEDKSTGKDERRISQISAKDLLEAADTLPSGALPTPTESVAGDAAHAEEGTETASELPKDHFEEGVEALSPVIHYDEEEGEGLYEHEHMEIEGEFSLVAGIEEEMVEGMEEASVVATEAPSEAPEEASPPPAEAEAPAPEEAAPPAE